MHAPLERIVAFLAGIGLPPRAATLDDGTFLPGIRITRGELVYDPARLAWPSDLLHEAGHIALTPAAHRGALDDALTAEQHFEHGGEVESIAWSYAASVRLSMPVEALFHEGGYRGHAPGLAQSFSLGVYVGVAGLAALGLCAIGEDARRRGIEPYPHMLQWLRD
ncbi:MAG: hypothetical protein ACTHK2_15575 [Dokdonella sp.]|uniref:hypothetical protein n=1 Tax=Dokdonella sp. TaxID=2291710 RepID=UPI003F80AD9A